MAELPDNGIIIKEPGILALGSSLLAIPSLSFLLKDERAVQVSCGFNHSAIVCESGRVFTFGMKLPLDEWIEICVTVTRSPNVRTPRSIRILQVACGDNLTFFVSREGEVFAMGNDNNGQLGPGHMTKSPEPVLVAGLPFVKKVAVGWDHAVALTDSGQVWVCGSNGYGQLGLGHNINQISFTRVRNVSEAIRDISCGAFHTALLLVSEVVLMSGCNFWGQLGLGHTEPVNLFQRTILPSTLAAITSGSHHTVALTVSGIAWAWGWNSCGQLGTGDKIDRSTPSKIVGLENYKITKVFAGYEHAAVLTEEGDVLVCGNGIDGQHGQDKRDVLLPSLLQKPPWLVQQVTFAVTYSLLLVASTQNNEPTSRTQDVQARSSATDIEMQLMKTLECPVCLKVMCAPINLCVRGHSCCAGCRSSTVNCSLCQWPYMKVRNISLESISTILPLPCVDCFEYMPAALLEKHADVCPANKYNCPVQRPA